jgi:threonine dehydrogenase-like Zn-dependent dehydrogenase
VLSEPVAAKRRIGLRFGADKTLDPFGDNLGYHVFDMTNDVGFDAIFECSGIRANVEQALDFIGIRGTITVVSVINASAKIPLRRLNFTEARITASISNTHEENRRVLKWMAEGKLDGHPMISDLITLEQLPSVFEERILAGQSNKVMLQIGEEF